ncbi:MAG: DUF4177 domain-containing protein [Pseudorhodobacter sp.]|nr:DUF4177 domain-containing protein [Pseudorhodobacter sp.]
MPQFEYKVVPSPRKGEKAPGAKTVAERFAVALSTLMNRLGQEGWEYLRADALPCDERVGLTGSKTTFQSMLVFRRSVDAAAQMPVTDAPLMLAEPVPFTPVLGAATAPVGVAPALGPAQGLAAE